MSTLSKRERRYLTSSLSLRKNSVALDYKKLGDVLQDAYDERFEEPKQKQERWVDDEVIENGYESRFISPSGSVGEWLERAACPAEQKNYLRFINCLERFERESGMKISPTGDGFIVPLGPDLKASIQIYI
mmetsp:Transcript_40778/g.41640  ORF Transcript_40778/g.41640 Transcript_40778/m.41640 type:complete len:131 (+) Transcript_40778:624-1016(+)